jgi:hypothetical protein
MGYNGYGQEYLTTLSFSPPSSPGTHPSGAHHLWGYDTLSSDGNRDGNPWPTD